MTAESSSARSRMVATRSRTDRLMEVTMMRKLILVFVSAAALAGCSNSATSVSTGGGTPSVNVATPTPPPPPAWTVPLMQQTYHPSIDPSKFTAKITNPYFPLIPGTVLIYEGTRDGVPLRIEFTVTTDTKTILGVKCLAIRDIVSG